MLNSLLQKLQELAGRRTVAFDPAALNDPVALQTAWSPARGGGASFRTHRLVTVDPGRLEFRATVGACVFYLLFLLVGLGVAGLVTAGALRGTDSQWLSAEVLGPLLIGLLFALIGGAMLYFGTAPIVFDTRHGCFWKGRQDPAQVPDKRGLKNFAQLPDIHALQIISEYCSGKNSFYSYELNLVLRDGSRINVVDHGNLAALREDGAKLAQFLGRPLWDGLAPVGGGAL